MRKWEELPADMRVPEVRKYYDILQRHKGSLILKRVFDKMCIRDSPFTWKPRWMMWAIKKKFGRFVKKGQGIFNPGRGIFKNPPAPILADNGIECQEIRRL